MTLHVGCHLSFAKGYEALGRMALDIDASTFAFFTRNPRGGTVRPLDVADRDALVDLLEMHEFGSIVAHAPYTLNLCSAKEDVRDFGRRALAEDIERLEGIPGALLNFHPGSHTGQGAEVGVRQVAEGLNSVIVPGQRTTVLLETMAGKGSEVGRTFEELAQILELVDHDEVMGVCLDTCHVHDGGYDIAGDLDGVLDTFDHVIGLERLRALHLNDSKNPLGAHKDRHELLGQGYLGADCFAAIVQNKRLRGLPMVLETPNDLDGYAREIAWLRDQARER